MSLFRIIYVSTVSDAFQAPDIESLLEKCKANNRQLGVTGLLCFNHLYFLQYLEGEEQHVRKIFENIRKDNRHSNIKVMDSNPEDSRMFENWEMGYVFLSRDMKELNLSFTDDEKFCPYTMDPEQLIQYLLKSKELVVTI
ncbi:MAG: BLUF domain-containing protein [Kangiellaceae bacterium]|nr:BLUF domain-containing protein [Kangiellaceae bacterium]MCW8998234.1 BLUF domain-containing protein [Kangiellaceae bacterium]MCW9015442.1 BLUF domain-containing protein [Kangiellaceae bacterium]